MSNDDEMRRIVDAMAKRYPGTKPEKDDSGRCDQLALQSVDWRAKYRHAEADRIALRAEVERLKAEAVRLAALVEKACDAASEAWSYLPDDHEARAAIAAEVNEIAGTLRKKEADHA